MIGANDQVATYLSRYPESITLRQGPRRPVLFLFLGFAIATAFSCKQLVEGDRNGLLGLALGGINVLLFGFLLLNGRFRLVLDTDGFEIQSRFRNARQQWKNVSNIRAGAFVNLGSRPPKTVIFDCISGPKFGFSCSEMSAEELAVLMTSWQQNALGKTAAFAT